MTTLRPLDDRIVVERIPDDEVSAGGIFIPIPEKGDQGIVLAVGPGLFKHGRRIALTVKPGDRVIFQKLAGLTVEVDKTEFLILRAADIMGVVQLADVQ
jgi:chaperonin GroES